ncbi:MAG: hypothetical protein AB2603_17990 [Candidatus Thiodiazotropha endolucinida]
MKRSTIIASSVLLILALSLQGCGDNGGSSGNPPDIGGQGISNFKSTIRDNRFYQLP